MEVKELCQAAIKHCDCLADALQFCEGLFPTIALSRLMEVDRKVLECWIRNGNQKLSTEKTNEFQQDSFALSTWQFSENCRTRLRDLLWRNEQRVCLLGVPSLVEYLPSNATGLKNLLIDVSKSIHVNQETTIHLPYDINLLEGSEFAETFDVCVFDPPWYLENYFKWIEVALSYCKIGGTIAFPLLGRMTRMDASQDREWILANCEARGLEFELYRGIVLYDPPSFERSILLRNGIPPVQWKRADLVVATRVDSKCASIVDGVPPIAGPKPIKPMRQFVIGQYLIDIVLDRSAGYGSGLFRTPLGGYWMKTPSRKEIGLSDCNVYVSNGARLICERPLDLGSQLEEMGGSPEQTIMQLGTLGFPIEIFS